MRLPRNALDWLIFGVGGSEGGERRYTQDSPVLPDVWIAFGMNPGLPQELLIAPDRSSRPGEVTVALRARLGIGPSPGDPEGEPESDREGGADAGHGLAYTESTVAARLTLDETVRHVLPLTAWWRRMVTERLEAAEEADRRTPPDREPSGKEPSLDQRLAAALESLGKPDATVRGRRFVAPKRKSRKPETRRPELPPDLVWLARIAGWLVWAETQEEPDWPGGALDDLREFHAWRQEEGPGPDDLVSALIRAFGGDPEKDSLRQVLPEPPADGRALIWLVNRNRPAELAVRDSRLAIKADAAWRLFEISCAKLTWAVVDSGIDATHPAFRRIDPATKKPYFDPFPTVDGRVRNRTRIERTFDFSRTRLLLDPQLLTTVLDGTVANDTGRDSGDAPEVDLPASVARAIEGLLGGQDRWSDPDAHERQSELLREHVGDLLSLVAGDGALAKRLEGQLEDLRDRLKDGQDVDWALLEPFLEVRPDQYWIPASDHGTHVAGILAGSWKRDGETVEGICPDLALYDFRVLPTGKPGPEDELNVIAALQFLRHLNRQKDTFVLHGANLSLSIPHEVANYACGRTPVCDEAARVASAGVVVVAAAGNNGYVRYRTAQGEREGYHTISITDPGNAEDVITVGATHRNRPHTYGVSYFSSRGPTGDGRSKPDLVAPGEKIRAPIFDSELGEKDGTSMAAPHVSGAAAMVMARHRELVGRPDRIKEILCSSATDLGREHYFQGRGMLDVLRALQSI